MWPFNIDESISAEKGRRAAMKIRLFIIFLCCVHLLCLTTNTVFSEETMPSISVFDLYEQGEGPCAFYATNDAKRQILVTQQGEQFILDSKIHHEALGWNEEKGISFPITKNGETKLIRMAFKDMKYLVPVCAWEEILHWSHYATGKLHIKIKGQEFDHYHGHGSYFQLNFTKQHADSFNFKFYPLGGIPISSGNSNITLPIIAEKPGTVGIFSENIIHFDGRGGIGFIDDHATTTNTEPTYLLKPISAITIKCLEWNSMGGSRLGEPYKPPTHLEGLCVATIPNILRAPNNKKRLEATIIVDLAPLESNGKISIARNSGRKDFDNVSLNEVKLWHFGFGREKHQNLKRHVIVSVHEEEN